MRDNKEKKIDYASVIIIAALALYVYVETGESMAGIIFEHLPDLPGLAR